MTESSSAADKLAAYISDACGLPLPDTVTAKAKQHLIDSIAAMVSGAALEPGRLAIDYARQLGGTEEACVPGSRLVTNAVNAALASGMCAHADETDDSHQPAFFHPGCAIVPAALAMAERGHRSGQALLRAVVLGYDVGARFSLALGAMAFHKRGLSSHTFAGTFGATAAAGALAGLSAQQCRWLLSYATQQASGISTWMRDPHHVEKAFALGGMTARNAVSAATMVESGMTGVEDSLTGSPNFLIAFQAPSSVDTLAEGLGERFEVLRANIKKWSVGSPVQATLDSIEALMIDHALSADEVESVRVRVRDDEAAIVDNRDMPNINLQHLVALMLVDGKLDFANSHDFARMRDERVQALRQRVTLEHSPQLREAGGRQAQVEVHTRTLGVLRHHTVAVRGAADNPMTDAEVDAKCTPLFAGVLGEAQARRLADALWRIEEVADVSELRELLRLQ